MANAPLIDFASRSLINTQFGRATDQTTSNALRALLFGGALGY
jgi:hypothetical protein